MDLEYHIPALLDESIDALKIRPDGTYVDLTFGGGGHSRAILKRLEEGGRLVAFDQDADAKDNADAIQDRRFTFVQGNFRYMNNFLRYLKIDKVDGVVGDLGVSWHQFDTPQRGFSFRFEQSPLDMRMNTQTSITAADIINTYTQNDIAHILRAYGEAQRSVPIARLIVRARESAPIATTGDLLNALQMAIPHLDRNRFLARIFQALRIAVNDEMAALIEALNHSAQALRIGGRLAIISYHSLEDRIVKNFIRTGSADGTAVKDVYGNFTKPLSYANAAIRYTLPTDREIKRNPRARSAKLRVAKRVA